MDSSEFARAQREAIRTASLQRHGLTEADLHDWKRPTAHSASKNRARDTLVTPSAEDEFFAGTDKPELPDLLLNLTEREQQVMVLRYGMLHQPEHTQAEAALRLGISQQRVAFLEAAALSKLRSLRASAVA